MLKLLQSSRPIPTTGITPHLKAGGTPASIAFKKLTLQRVEHILIYTSFLHPIPHAILTTVQYEVHRVEGTQVTYTTQATIHSIKPHSEQIMHWVWSPPQKILSTMRGPVP